MEYILHEVTKAVLLYFQNVNVRAFYSFFKKRNDWRNIKFFFASLSWSLILSFLFVPFVLVGGKGGKGGNGAVGGAAGAGGPPNGLPGTPGQIN